MFWGEFDGVGEKVGQCATQRVAVTADYGAGRGLAAQVEVPVAGDQPELLADLGRDIGQVHVRLGEGRGVAACGGKQVLDQPGHSRDGPSHHGARVPALIRRGVVAHVSTSMEATDVEPSRIEAAKQAAEAFVDRLPERFNVGLVTFASSALMVVAPTHDHAQVRAAIDTVRLGPGTAIGEAVYSSLQGIAASDGGTGTDSADPAPARIVLMSDGSNTSGRSPEQAAQAARAAGVRVSTIAYGTPDGSVTINGRTLRVPADAESLRALADDTGGQAYEAASGEELGQVYEDIGSSIGTRAERQEVSAWFLGAGLAAAALAAAFSLVWFSRLP